MDTLLEEVDDGEAAYVIAFCDGDYTTNLPLEDVTGGKAWVAYNYDEQTAGARARRPGAPAGARTSTSGRAPSGCAASG